MIEPNEEELEKAFKNWGSDSFPCNRFNDNYWTAKELKTLEEIRDAIESLKIVGKTIKSFKAVGLCYNLGEDRMADSAYYYYEQQGIPEENICSMVDYPDIDPFVPIPRHIEIDEPLLIEFSKGDRLEILSPWEAQYKMSINHIPWNIEHGIIEPNADANTIFSPCIGERIVGYQIDMRPSCWNVGEVSDVMNYQEDRPNFLILWLSNGQGLQFWAEDWDYAHVCLINRDISTVTIPFGELKGALFQV